MLGGPPGGPGTSSRLGTSLSSVRALRGTLVLAGGRPGAVPGGVSDRDLGLGGGLLGTPLQ